MSAAYAAFEVRPEAFNRVGVRAAAHPFLAVVSDRRVREAEPGQRLVEARLVGADAGPRCDVLPDDGEDVFLAGVGERVRHQIAAPLHHAEHGGLVGVVSRLAKGLRAVSLAADKGLVHFHVAAESVVTVHLTHELADLVAHAPCGLVGHA